MIYREAEQHAHATNGNHGTCHGFGFPNLFSCCSINYDRLRRAVSVRVATTSVAGLLGLFTIVFATTIPTDEPPVPMRHDMPLTIPRSTFTRPRPLDADADVDVLPENRTPGKKISHKGKD